MNYHEHLVSSLGNLKIRLQKGRKIWNFAKLPVMQLKKAIPYSTIAGGKTIAKNKYINNNNNNNKNKLNDAKAKAKDVWTCTLQH